MNRNGSFLVGGVFIFIGILWFLISKDMISFSIMATIVSFWPALLIILGLNIIFKENQLVKFVSVILVLILVVFGIYFEDKDNSIGFDIGFVSGDGDNVNKSIDRGKIEETEMVLNLDYGDINFDSGSDSLIDFNIPDNGMEYFYTEKTKSSKLTFSDKDNIFKDEKDDNEDRVYYYTLNEDVVWDMDINSGAIDGKFDFSDIHLRTLSINLGAGDIYMKIGSKEENCKIEVNSATIALEIDADEELGIVVKNSGPISEFNFDEDAFTKNGNSYTSKNYSSADKKLEIQLNTALSDISINRY